MLVQYEIKGGDFTAAGKASSEIKKILKQLNIEPVIIRRVAVALYEAEINVVAHAYNGIMLADIAPTGINVKVTDNGPGIADIGKAMQEGFSTASNEVRQMGFGAGMGLPNIKKNTDRMELTSILGVGTTLNISVNF